MRVELSGVLVLLLAASSCKDEPSNVNPSRTVADAQPVERHPMPPDAAPPAPWELRDLAQAKDASGSAPFSVKIELPTTATVAARREGGRTPVADVNALGVSFTLQELDRPGTFESVKKSITPGLLRLAEKEPGGHSFIYLASDGSGAQVVSVTRGKILCGAGGLDDAKSQVVLRACRSIRP
jgi:hypothetical protein